MDFVSLILVCTITLLAAIRLYYWSKRQTVCDLPTPGRHFLIGNSGHFLSIKSPHPHVPKTAVAFQTLYGIAHLMHKEGMFMLPFGNKNLLFLYGPHTIEVLLSSKLEIDKGTMYRPGEKLIGGGLLLNKGDEWRKNRKLLTPAFHFRILEDYVPIMNDQAKIFIQKLNERTNDECVDITEYAMRCTFDIILETAMGTSLGAQNDKNCGFLTSLETVMGIWLQRVVMPFYNSDLVFNNLPVAKEMSQHTRYIRDFTRKVVLKKKAEMMEKLNNPLKEEIIAPDSPPKRRAFLDLLLNHQMGDQTNYTDDTVIGETLLFVGAGHDTTAVALSWCTFLLGHHEDIQEKAYQEIREIFGDDRDCPILPEHMKLMKYLECCIKESQRLYPSINTIARKLRCDTKIDGKIVPKNTTCIVMFDALHRNPDVYPVPEIFDPDRFSPDNVSGRHPFAFAPFSAGPRNCIGQRFAMMEEKILLTNIIRNFRIKSLDHRDKVMILPQIVGKPNLPLRVKFTVREM